MSNNFVQWFDRGVFCLYRGDEFRTAFASIGELRSIIPSNVNIIAVTATATRETFEAVKYRLSLQEPVVVGISPDRPNIFLEVSSCMLLKPFIETVASEMKRKRLNYPKTIIFCRSYQDCIEWYSEMIDSLGSHKTDPPGYPNLLQYRMVTMYTGASTVSMKKMVMDLFMQQDSVLRVLIATSAFSMGVDCSNIHQVIHWGAPSDLEQYLQEIGRAGRDDELSHALLICSKRNRHVRQQMKNYCDNNESCRRLKLFRSFLLYTYSATEYIKCRCCDICRTLCDCSNCSD